MSGTFLKRLLAGTCLLAGTMLAGVNLGYLYPAGAQAGTTVQIIIGGQGLWGYNQLFVTGGGVTLVRLQYAPGTFYAGCGEQYTWVREYLNEVANGGSRQPLRNDRNFGVWRYPGALEQLDQLDPLMLSLACKGVFERPNSLQASPAIAQTVILTLQIDADAAPGLPHEHRRALFARLLVRLLIDAGHGDDHAAHQMRGHLVVGAFVVV